MTNEYAEYHKIPYHIRNMMSTYIAYVELAETYKKYDTIHDYYRLKAQKIMRKFNTQLEAMFEGEPDV